MKEIKFKGKFVVKANIVLKTGLHIGTEESMEIGGIDNPVIKDATGKPFIPGSSLKGKLRSLMEYFHEKIEPEKMVITVRGNNPIRIHMCDEADCPVCNLFGRNHGSHELANKKNEESDKKSNGVKFENLMPTRLIVRDAFLNESSITEEMKENLTVNYTEVKPENTLDRITSAANPRSNERVPAGVAFNSEFIVNVYEGDGVKYLKELLTAFRLLEDDYLGGSGSRGYGKVKLENIVVEYRDKKFYEQESEAKILNVDLNNLNWEEIEKNLKIGDWYNEEI